MCGECLSRFSLTGKNNLSSDTFFIDVGLAWICKWTSMGSLLAYQGHGIAEWKNDAKFFHCFINKNGHVLDRIDYKHCIPKGAIETTQGKKVVFCDSTEEEVDVIIQCTGYKTEFPMLSAAVRATPITDNYKYIFNMKDRKSVV